MDTTEPNHERRERSAQRLRHLQDALFGYAVAGGRLAEAKERRAQISELATIIETQGRTAKEDERSAAKDAARATENAHAALFYVLDSGVNHNDILDAWFSYRFNLRGSGVEADRALQQDRLDREAFERLEPGTKIISLHYAPADSPVADTVASLPRLESRSYQELGLTVVFETEGTRAAQNDDGIEADLQGLSQSILIGEDAIVEYFKEYKPPILEADFPAGDPRLYEAEMAIDYIDALRNHGLATQSKGAIRKLTRAVTRNCCTLIGLEKDGGLGGITTPGDEALTFLTAIRRLNPQAYEGIYDHIARALSGYRWSDSYVALVAAVEHEDSNIGIKEKAATLEGLNSRAHILTEASAT